MKNGGGSSKILIALLLFGLGIYGAWLIANFKCDAKITQTLSIGGQVQNHTIDISASPNLRVLLCATDNFKNLLITFLTPVLIFGAGGYLIKKIFE
jgi:hypothetical protein